MKPTRKRGPKATPEVGAQIGRVATCNGNAKAVRAFPGVTDSTVPYLQHNILLAGQRWTCHSVRASPRRRPVLLGSVVDQQVCLQTYLTKLLQLCGVVNSATTLAAARGIQKATGSGQLHYLGRGWSKSVMERMGFIMRKATRTAKKMPPHFEELNESYEIFDSGGEQHSSCYDSQLGSDRRANGARQRLDHDN